MVFIYFKHLAVAEQWSIYFNQCQNETQYKKNKHVKVGEESYKFLFPNDLFMAM